MSFSQSWKAHLLVLVGIAPCVSLLAAQQPGTTSVEDKVVHVLATVRDRQGKIVNNLSQDDFVLKEDGEPQTIKYFSRETDLPLTLGLLVDTSSRNRKLIDQERSASSNFVDQVLREDKDKVFLIHFDREVELLQDLTSSRQKLISRLQQLQASAPDRDRDSGGYPGGGGSGSAGRSQHRAGDLLYDSVFLASDEMLQKQKGRKAIIVLSDGVDRGSKTSLNAALEAAQRADTVVYTILFADSEDNQGQGRWSGGGGINGPWGGRRPGGGGGYPRPPQPREEQHADGKQVLQHISEETGGRMFEISKKQSVDQIYKQIQDELRNQYSLGYVPSEQGGNSEYHTIHLTTKQADLAVQARDGYYITRATAKESRTKGTE